VYQGFLNHYFKFVIAPTIQVLHEFCAVNLLAAEGLNAQAFFSASFRG
jgi:hypothetical protein